ncbi:MAG: c-type cytochrome [Xanthomonadales bacterium]|jgi:cytochrome c5|nr:c-type cytochrome [Xanthomonadales bacterium]
MSVFYRSLWMVALIGLMACSPGGEDVAAPEPLAQPEPRDVRPTWREDHMALGKETYQLACASCHESGDLGAPITGNRDQWEERSNMWQAVLFKHAKSGYLDMPGKGGQPNLSDEAVEAATEYMLGLTFPDRPAD